MNSSNFKLFVIPIFLFLGLITAVLLVLQRQYISQKAAPLANQTEVTLTPPTSIVPLNQPYQIPIHLSAISSPSGLGITGVKLVFHYTPDTSPSLPTLTSPLPDWTFHPSDVDTQNHTFIYEASYNSSGQNGYNLETQPNGTVTFGILNLQSATAGTYTLTLDTTLSAAYAKSNNSNTLSIPVTSYTITIGTPVATPTPTPTLPPSACNLTATWTQAGSDIFDSISGISSDPSGNIYITHKGTDVVVMDSNGTYIRNWGTPGTGDGQIFSAYGLHVDAQSNVFVPTDHRVEKFTSTGAFLLRLGRSDGLPGTANGEFSFPQDVTTDSAGNIYVADSGNFRIQVFSSTGTFITKWGSQGSATGQFSTYFAITSDPSGNIYTAEINRVQKFTSTGTLLASWTIPTNATDITTDPAGNLYLTFYGFINRYTSDGIFLDQTYLPNSTDLPAGSIVDNQNHLHVAISGGSILTYLCPAIVPPTNTPVPPTGTPTTTPVPGATVTPTPTVVQENLVRIGIHVQGVTSPAANQLTKTFHVLIVQNSNQLINGDYTFTYTGGDFYESTPPLSLGTSTGLFDIYVKGPSHLQKKFTAIPLYYGTNFPPLASPLLAGDMYGNNTPTPDNKLNSWDLGAFLTVRTQDEITPITSTNQIYDLNFDGKINSIDLGLILVNRTQDEILGDF